MLKVLKGLYLLSLLIYFDYELSHHGFNKTFKKYARKYSQTEIDRNPESILKKVKPIYELFDLLDIVCAWYPKKADCIHKSFLGYRIIRKKYALPVEIVIGLRKFPFEAHAWLQINGKNFFNDDDQTNKFTVILSTNQA